MISDKVPDVFSSFAANAEDEQTERMTPAILRGEWVDGIMRTGEYAVLRKRAGGFLLLDREAVKQAAFALGIRFARGEWE